MSRSTRVTSSEGAQRRKQVARRVTIERRRRIIRSALAFLAISFAMVLLSMANRESAAIRSCQRRMEYAVEEFRRIHREGRPTPTSFPIPADAVVGVDAARDLRQLRSHVHYNVFFGDWISQGHSEVGVCCCQQPHTRLFASDGRHVIIYNVPKATYYLVWMDRAEFRRRAPELGLPIHMAGDAN